MSRTRGNNPFELAIRTSLHRAGARYRVNYPLPEMPRRSADLAFPRLKIAVFLDGCFWHACPLHDPGLKNNSEFWTQKRLRNQMRDQETNQRLRDQGWLVLRYWEHEEAETIVASIRRHLAVHHV